MNRQLRNAFLSLVKSLSPAEKRLISLNISKSGKKSTSIIDLIRIVQKLDAWDEDFVQARIQSSRLDHRIVYASKKIFTSISSRREGRNQWVLENILNLETAIELNLEFYVKNFLEELIDDTNERELFELQLYVVSIASQYLQRSDSYSRNADYIKNLDEIRGNALKRINTINSIYKIKNEKKAQSLINFLQTGEKLKVEIPNLIEFDSDSTRETIEVFAIQAFQNLRRGEIRKALEYHTMVVDQINLNEWYKKENPIFFFDKILAIILTGCHLEEVEIVFKYFPLIEKNKTLHSHWNYYHSLSTVCIYYNLKIDVNVKGTIKFIKKKLPDWKNDLSGNELIRLLFTCQNYSWDIGDFKECVMWGEELRDFKSCRIRRDLLGVSYLYSACSSLETGNLSEVIKYSKSGISYIREFLPDFSTTVQILMILKEVEGIPIYEIKSYLQAELEGFVVIENRELDYFRFNSWLKKFS